MQRKIAIACLLVISVLLALVAQNVSAQGYDNVQITNVLAPSSVGAGQSLTVIVDVSYRLQAMGGEGLILTMREHGEIGNFYPLTAASSNCAISSTFCFVTPSNQFGMDAITVSLTINAPNTLGKWQPSVIAEIVSLTANLGSYTPVLATARSFIVTITEAVPETTSVTSVSVTPYSWVTPAASSPTSSFQMPQPPQSSNSQSTSNTPQLVLVIVAIAAVALVALLLNSRRTKQPKSTKVKKSESKSKTKKGKNFCIECGEELPPKSKFCNKCGTKQP